MQLSLLIVFFISGFSALIYQVAWQRLLTVYYGVGAVSITLIVSIYMLGLGLGALLGGWLAEKRKDSIGLYFWIELGIGFFGLISFPLLMAIGRLSAGSSYAVAALYEMTFLLIPTLLMGMSLPVLIKIFSRIIADLSRSVSRLYFVNTLGGATGSLVASFYLISFLGIKSAIYTAGAINLFLAMGILLVRKFGVKNVVKDEISPPMVVQGAILKYAPVLVFVTGFFAIGYELIWFRVISVLVKSSSYVFASVLAIYLLGIALGSFIIGKFLHTLTVVQRISLFFRLQVLIALSIAMIFMGYFYLTLHTPFKVFTTLSFSQFIHPPIYYLLPEFKANNLLVMGKQMFLLGTVLIWPAFFLLIPTMLMGASFPLIVSAFEKKTGSAAWVTAKVYFFNVMGNVFGGLVTGLLLLPVLGSELTVLCFIVIGLFFAFPVLSENKSRLGYFSWVLILLVIVFFFPKPGEIYKIIHPVFAGFKTYFAEGRDGVVMTYVNEDGTVHNYINGDSHGGRPAYSFYIQVVEAAGVAKNIENILVIGYGTGSVTEGILKMPGVKKVTVVELNHTLLDNLRRIPLFQDLMKDSRLEFIVDDGRRFLQSHTNEYDVVFMSPLRATTAYSNNIYSQQFFELVAKRLSSHGIFVVWSDSLDVTFRTLDAVFPFKRLHVRNSDGFYIASNKPLRLARNTDVLRPFMDSFDSFNQGRIIAAVEGVRMISQEVLREYTYHYTPAQDWLPVSEYYLGAWFSKHIIKKNK